MKLSQITTKPLIPQKHILLNEHTPSNSFLNITRSNIMILNDKSKHFFEASGKRNDINGRGVENK